jgi:CheY-like chemotaxis protein
MLRQFSRKTIDGSVLVIDDDPEIRTLTRQMLERIGMTVGEAVNGAEGLAWLAANQAPSIILLDLMMPVMDGFEFLEELRNRTDSRNVPIVVVTSKDLTEDDRSRLNGGVERIIQKTERDSMLRELHVELARCITRRRSEVTAEA